MGDVEDAEYKSEILKEAEAIDQRAKEKCAEVLDILDAI